MRFSRSRWTGTATTEMISSGSSMSYENLLSPLRSASQSGWLTIPIPHGLRPKAQGTSRLSLQSKRTGLNGDGAQSRQPPLGTTRRSPRSSGATVRRKQGVSHSRLTGPWAAWRRAGRVHSVRPVGFSSTPWYRCWPLIARGCPRVKLTCRLFSRSSLQTRSVPSRTSSRSGISYGFRRSSSRSGRSRMKTWANSRGSSIERE